MAKLTRLQRRFVQEYLVDLNATQAAVRAGYSKRTADVIGYENLRKPQIVNAVEHAMEERAARTQVNADSVVEAYARIAFALTPRQPITIRDKLMALNALARHVNLWPLRGTREDPLHLVLGTDDVDLTTKSPEELKRIDDAINVLLEAEGIVQDAREASGVSGEGTE